MSTNKSMPAEPFWMDEPNPYSDSISNSKGSPYGWLVKSFLIWFYIISYIIFPLIVFVQFKSPFSWIFVGFYVVLFSAALILPRFRETRQSKALRIQQLAKERTGADFIGSAIHTAGHPLLKADQPLVLALKDTEICIYSYDSPTPIDTIPVKTIQTVDLVVFDDNHVPHVGVIDNTAQSLQFSFQRNNITYTCSFRRFYKVRAVDWYHAIQTARVME